MNFSANFFMGSYRFARSETVTNVTLEYNSVALGEAESLVGALQSCSVWHEAREDGGVRWAAVLKSR